MTSADRIKWLDALKLFTMFLVVWGHMIPWCFSIKGYEDPCARIIAIIAMPLFMSMSGFCGAELHNRSFVEVLFGKARRLLLPCFSCGIISALYLKYVFGDGETMLNLLIIWLFWFLKSAFVCSVVYYLATVKSQYKWYLIVLTLIVSQFPFQSRTIDAIDLWWMYPCFVFGALVKEHFEFVRSNDKRLFIASIVIFVIMFMIYKSIFATRHDYYDPYSDSYYVLCFFFRIYKTVMGISGSLMFITLFEYLSRHLPPPSGLCATLCKCGQYTLGIYCFHMMIGRAVFDRYVDFGSLDGAVWHLLYFIVVPLMAMALMIVCVGIIKIIHHSGWLSCILLGEQCPVKKCK